MNRDIIARKRKFEPLDLSFEENIDHMFERQWTFGQWVLAIIGSGVAVGLLLIVGNIVIGLD